MNRAYSVLEIKATEEVGGKRTFAGIASTPSTDRMGDIVEPKGAEFKLPIPLLWQHDARQPIGWVTKAKVTDKGIEVEGEVAAFEEEGTLKDRLTEAWQMLKAKLVRGLSIGFNPIESARIDGTYGMRFLKWEWLELSAVTIAANQDATITAIKSIDQALLTASGQRPGHVVTLNPPGVSGKQQPTVSKSISKTKEVQMNVKEQIKAFLAKQQAAAARMEELLSKSAEEGRTFDETETQEYEALESDVKAIESHLARLKALDAKQEKDTQAAGQQAVPVSGDTAKSAGAARAGSTYVAVKSNQPPGVALAQVAKMLGRAQGNRFEALQIAQAEKNIDPRVQNVLKAAVAAGSTASGNWLGELVGDETSVYADFLEFLRPQTIIGRFGQGGVPDLRRVPFRVPLIGQTGGGEGYWVGEGAAKPLTNFDFTRNVLEPLKVANIAVVTEEALRATNPQADVIIRDQLVAALRARLDIDFIDPAKAAVSGVSPGSITNGVTGIAASGADGDAVRADMKAMFAPFIAANNAPSSAVLIMSASTALALSLMTNALGQSEFPNITMNGGNLRGIPVIVSEYVPVTTAGAMVVMVNASDIYLGDEGDFAIDVSREASLQMDNAPTMNSTTPTGASVVSMFQTNSVAFRAERTMNWARRRASAVSYLTGVTWGAAA